MSQERLERVDQRLEEYGEGIAQLRTEQAANTTSLTTLTETD